MMPVQHIKRILDSETLYLPELRAMIGQAVEIIVFADPPLTQNADWKAAAKAAESLRTSSYDFDGGRSSVNLIV